MIDKMGPKNTNEIDEKTASLKISSTHPNIIIGKIDCRQSTPDSEVLTSSDDEADRLEQSQTATYRESQVRRASWLNGSSPILSHPRKASFTSSSMSPTTSQPSTPSADPSIWGNQSSNNSGNIRGHSGTSNFPWGNGIWNNDTRKELPSRLTEVLPSPTAVASPLSSSNGFHGDSGSTNRDQQTNPPIPFVIPLHPTPKTYRSQSYSVGQLDLDSPATSNSHGGMMSNSRGRQIQHPGLFHRPPRSSLLSETPNESFLCNVEEVEDCDYQSINGSGQGAPFRSNEAKTIEFLTRENAILRQQQHKNLYAQPRSSANAFPFYNFPGALLEKSDSAIEEFDEANEYQQDTPRGAMARKLCDYRSKNIPKTSPFNVMENRKAENVKKGFWQSSLGFGGLEDIPQSRRHSFATIPTRNNTAGSIAEPLLAHDSGLQDSISREFPKKYQDQAGQSFNDHITAYFGGISNIPRKPEIYSDVGYQQQSSHPFAQKNTFNAAPAASPHRNMYGASQPRINQSLYVVLFKCSRSDIFYIQEGTGLSVKSGDLVIVEADRGTDLGTVARANVDWATAKEYRDFYSEEHYKWLMMYSKGASGVQDVAGAGPTSTSNSLQRSTVGGMGPPTPYGVQESCSSEVKPKIIKRLAQKHEIQALNEKELNEAKAKRVCMQKVKEHGLHMEILDAEFQMDWKKLTFYYFADAYINFNSLVTDLFKAYKTRIWMSAINPASFATPFLGLTSPNGIGPCTVTGVCPRTQGPEQKYQQQPTQISGRSYQAPYTQKIPQSLEHPFTPYLSPPYSVGFPPFFEANLHDKTGGYGQTEPFINGSSEFQENVSHYSSLNRQLVSPKDTSYPKEQIYVPPKDVWIKSFQGLSMNSR